jgi:hypothetical protein
MQSPISVGLADLQRLPMMQRSGPVIAAPVCDKAQTRQPARHGRMRCPKQRPPDYETLPVACLGSVEIAKIAAGDSKIVQAGRHIRVGRPEREPPDTQRLFMMPARRRLIADR